MKVLVVLDDVDDSDQIDYMGVRHFGYGSKTIITSRDRQVLESGGADTIHEVKGLNENCSLQLFSNFAFKQLNPAVGFQDLSRRFVKYTQGNPLALKVLGSDLNKRSINYWEILRKRRPNEGLYEATLNQTKMHITPPSPPPPRTHHEPTRASSYLRLAHLTPTPTHHLLLIHPSFSNQNNIEPDWNYQIHTRTTPSDTNTPSLGPPTARSSSTTSGLTPPSLPTTSQPSHSLSSTRTIFITKDKNYLSETGIKEVPDFIEHLDRLQWLTLTNSMVKDVSSNISKLKSLFSLDLSGCPIVKFPTVDVRSPSLRFKSLKYMHMDRCKSLKLLTELPPYLLKLNVLDCTSLEKVSFADQNLYQFDYLDAGDACFYEFTMLFRNCFNLNQESINNIEANAMLKIRSLAKKWAARFDCCGKIPDLSSLICCFPGNKISANKFKCQSMNSSLSLKTAPNGGGGSRFLPEKYKDYHVFILSTADMVKEDQNYEEASFKFYIRLLDLRRGGKEYIKVERCGVHVFYVDAESDTDATDASDATEKRHAGNKRSFSHDGEEADGGLKRLK
ncbi:hypothetical protein GOBAR_DD17708 [Gossypium barbadense]|nr:hypothetical protein GOBAR_DD17708 [Gossypium barbadense]